MTKAVVPSTRSPRYKSPAQSIAALLLAAVAFTACGDENVNEPLEATAALCHFAAGTGALTNVPVSQVPSHLAHGDYYTALRVVAAGAATDATHFPRITDALAVAREARLAHDENESAACRITITVAGGERAGSATPSNTPIEVFPLVIDVPDITLKGNFVMQVDGHGRATQAANGDATVLRPTPALLVHESGPQAGVSEPIVVVNGHPNGPKGHGAVIEGFVFLTGHAIGDTTTIGGQAILTMRVTELAIRGNLFNGNFTERIDLRASSGTVERNFLAGPGGSCDICLAGPGTYTAKDNRIYGGGIPGILTVPSTLLPVPSMVEQQVLPDAATVTASLDNNEVRRHLRRPVGTGLRVGAVGIGAPNVAGTSVVSITRNNLVGNTFGLLIEAAFPVNNTTLRGDIRVTTSGNTVSESCQNSLFVSFTRHTTGLGINNGASLRNTTYDIALGGDFSWPAAWYSFPSGFGNTLVINGQPAGNGVQHSYDALRFCS